MRPLILTLTGTLVLMACELGSESGRVGREPPPAAAVLAPGQDVSLIDKLAAIDAEIEQALEGESASILTAEAMTDQLLHAPRDVDWLPIGYSVEARIRQIQAQADAIVATLRRGSSLSGVESELTTLRASVRHLQQQLQLPGGGSAPPPLDILLAQDPLRDAQAPVGAAAAGAAGTTTPVPVDTPVAPATPAPLGSPVTPPPDSLD